MLKWLFIGIVIIVIFFGGAFVFSYLDEKEDWSSLKKSTHPNMTFEQFESYFNVDPSKWELNGYNVTYLLEDKHGGWYKPERIIDFTTFKDYKKYQEWRIERDIKNNEQIQLNNEMEVLQDIEKDIKERMEKEVKKDGNS